MPIAIVIKKRSSDWKVHLYGDTAQWECGKTIESAIEKFIESASSRSLSTNKNDYVIFNG